MKKIMMTLFTIVLLFVCSANVSAMSESDLYAKLTATYNINGYNFTISAGDKVLAKKYLDAYEVSSKDADYIAGKIDEAVSAMRNSGVNDFSDFSKLPKSLKDTLRKLVEDIAANTSVKATVKKGKVVIFNPDGTVFAEITKTVKNTGMNMSIIVSLALVVVIAGAIILIKNAKVNA